MGEDRIRGDVRELSLETEASMLFIALCYRCNDLGYDYDNE